MSFPWFPCQKYYHLEIGTSWCRRGSYVGSLNIAVHIEPKASSWSHATAWSTSETSQVDPFSQLILLVTWYSPMKIHENPMKIPWTSHEISMKSHEIPMNIPWQSHENLMNIPWNSHEHPMTISWKSHENPMKIPRKSHENPMKIPWKSRNHPGLETFALGAQSSKMSMT